MAMLTKAALRAAWNGSRFDYQSALNKWKCLTDGHIIVSLPDAEWLRFKTETIDPSRLPDIPGLLIKYHGYRSIPVDLPKPEDFTLKRLQTALFIADQRKINIYRIKSWVYPQAQLRYIEHLYPDVEWRRVNSAKAHPLIGFNGDELVGLIMPMPNAS